MKNLIRRRGKKTKKEKTFTNVSDLPVTTAHQSRLRLFQPTRRPVRGIYVIETSWGKVKITGRLGQAHADIIESMLYTAEKVGLMPDGRLRLLVDPYIVRKTARLGGEETEIINNDIMGTVVDVLEPDHLKQKGHLIDHIYKAVDKDGTPLTKSNPLGGTREMWSVVFGPVGTKLIFEDLSVKYDPAKISCLRHGSSQAIVRLVLPHDIEQQPNGGWHVDTLIRQTCGNVNNQELRNRRREIKKDADSLAKLGIIYANGRITRK
jgi:hypothetical protein